MSIALYLNDPRAGEAGVALVGGAASVVYEGMAVDLGAADGALVWFPTPAAANALTGVSATGAIGSVGVSANQQLTGAASTGSAGNLGKTIAVALSGVSATAAAGSLGKTVSAALAGQSATGAAGALSTTRAQALTGVSATAATASLGPQIAVPLAGVAATGAVAALGSAPAPTRGVLIWGDFAAWRAAGKTASTARVQFRKAA